MHIFIMLITSVQSFKLIACKPWEELITQTCYPTWNSEANLKIVLRKKCRYFVKNYFFVCKNSHAHLQYIHNKYAGFQNVPLKTVRGVDYTNSIPYNAKSCLKWLSWKVCNSVKSNLVPLILAPPKSHMHIFNMSTTGMQGFKKGSLKTVGGVDYTKSIQ